MLAMVSALHVQPGMAQDSTRTRGPEDQLRAAEERDRRGWRFRPGLRAEAEYDHNIFLLPENRRSAPGSPSIEEVRSGRYASMESAYDLVGSVEASLRARGRAYAGRPFELTPTVGVRAHALNTALNGMWIGVAAQQDFRRERRLQVQARFVPESFRRNYLVGATDEDANGIITAGERRYAAGRASELNVGADYRHRLRKGRRGSPSAWADVGAGFEALRYSAPFAGRDLAGPSAGVRLLADLGAFRFDAGYRGTRLAAAPSQEVMLVREAAGRRAVSGTVNRSRNEHALTGGVSIGDGRRRQLSIDLEQRARTFTSEEPTDAVYRGRTDRRRSAAVELTSRRGPTRTFVRARYAGQQLNRGSSPADDEADYTRLRGALGLRLTF